MMIKTACFHRWIEQTSDSGDIDGVNGDRRLLNSRTHLARQVTINNTLSLLSLAVGGGSGVSRNFPQGVPRGKSPGAGNEGDVSLLQWTRDTIR